MIILRNKYFGKLDDIYREDLEDIARARVQEKTEGGTGLGIVLGGTLGGMAGHAIKKGGTGALVGGIAGAVGGGIGGYKLGKHMGRADIDAYHRDVKRMERMTDSEKKALIEKRLRDEDRRIQRGQLEAQRSTAAAMWLR